MKYYVYQLIDPNSNKPFYVGKGTGNRAWSHNAFKDHNNNPHKDNYVKKLHLQDTEPIVKIVEYFNDEQDAYRFEAELTESIGLKNLTNMVVGGQPPSKVGWSPTAETRLKRSRGLKGIPRTKEWCANLSKAKKGENNPMYGRKNPCSVDRQIAIIKTKNLPNYELYKTAITMMNNGVSADKVAKELNISRNVCFKLKNRTHLFFKAFPELV